MRIVLDEREHRTNLMLHMHKVMHAKGKQARRLWAIWGRWDTARLFSDRTRNEWSFGDASRERHSGAARKVNIGMIAVLLP